MNSRKRTGIDKPRAKKLSNPTSTGGAGTAFENRVQATRLLAMCLGSFVPSIQDGRIVELQFQARIHGHHTDDLVCHLELSDGQRIRTLLQMKRTLAAREKDKAFVDSVTAAWTDYNSPQFVRGRDSIFFIYDTLSTAAMKGAATVCNWARFCATAEEFLRKVVSESFSNAANRSALAVIRKIVETFAGRTIEDDELFDFVKHLNCLPHDLDQDGTVEHNTHLNSIRHAASLVGEKANPQEIWAALVAACVEANSVAGTITFGNLDSIIGGRLNALFSGARNFLASPFAVVTTGGHQVPSKSQFPDAVATELARFSGLLESLKESHLQTAVRDQIPAARDDSVNKLISRQLDGIHARIKEFRYRDGLEDLARLGEAREQFDAHQEARWHLLQGTCKWHIEDSKAAAADFIRAAELYKEDEKFLAAGIRGLLLEGNAAAAVAAGTEAMRTFPQSLAVWVITANARMCLGENISLEDIPDSLRGEADALQMLAWSLHKQGDKAAASQTALQALDSKNPSFFTRDTALSLCLENAARNAFSAVFHACGVNERAALERCVREFSPREEGLWQVQSPQTVAAVAANLASSYLLLGEPDVALTVLREAHARGVSSHAFLRIEMEALLAIGDRDAAIVLGKQHMSAMSLDALATFAQIAGDACDLDSLDKALEATKRLEPQYSRLQQDIIGMRWSVLAKSNMPAALQEVRASDWVEKHSISQLVAGAQVLRNASFPDEATERIQRALELVPESAYPGDKYLVAQSLLFANEYQQAASVLEQIAPLGIHSQFHADLLFCYIRSGRRAKAKELIDSFPSGWELHAGTRNIAMELGQLAGDWNLLSKLVPTEFEQEASKVRSWLLKVMVAARTSVEEVSAVLEGAPLELVGSVTEVAQLSSLELRHGYKERAMRRLYVMRRNRLDSTEVAATHTVVLLAITDELPFMEDAFAVVGPGTSVTVTNNEGQSQVFTLDPDGLPELPSTPEFLKAGSKEASTLIGLTMGAELPVADSQGEKRILTVRRICSSYRRLLELSQQALNAPIAPSSIAQMMTLHTEEDGKPDFSGLTRQLQKFNEHAKRAIDTYISSPITLGGLARLLGRDVLDIVRGWRQADPAIQVSGGNPAERAQVLKSLETGKGPYLIDSVTLVELGLLKCLDIISTLPNVLITSHTRDVLEAKLEEARTQRTMGTAFEKDGQLGFSEVTEEQRQQEIHFFQDIFDAVQRYCSVVAAYGTESLVPMACQIENVISQEEFSVVLAGAEHEATLISLDARLRALAAVFGIQGVWPQVLLMYARNLGSLSDISYSLATMHQLFANRSFVSVSADDLACMAYQGTEWLKFGLRRFTKYIAQPEIDFTSAFQVSVGFLHHLVSAGPCHFGAFCKILEFVSEGLFRHKNATTDLSNRLFQEVLMGISSRDLTKLKSQLLAASIRNGEKNAKLAETGEFINVQVLMCSSVPYIAYVPENHSLSAGENDLLQIKNSKHRPSKGDFSTSASNIANSPFR